jgi:hypothetical protein
VCIETGERLILFVLSVPRVMTGGLTLIYLILTPFFVRASLFQQVTTFPCTTSESFLYASARRGTGVLGGTCRDG